MWFSNLWQKFKGFLSGTSNTKSSPYSVPDKKQFTIHSRTTTRRSGKRFEIKGERQVQRSTAQQSGRIRITGQGRPKKCPQCGSKTTIIKANTGNVEWQCSEERSGCGFRW